MDTGTILYGSWKLREVKGISGMIKREGKNKIPRNWQGIFYTYLKNV